jgi:hypothetical protein
MADRPHFIFIGDSDHLVRELCLTLIEDGFLVSVIAPAYTKIINFKGLTHRLVVPADDAAGLISYLKLNTKLLKELSGVFIWPSDYIMRLISESDLEKSIKEKILPLKTSQSARMFDSKVGQLNYFESCGLLVPRSEVVKSSAELEKISGNFENALVKADRGGGGLFIKEFTSSDKRELYEIPDSWYPLVVQEKIEGTIIGVEAFYLDGQLVFWIFSDLVAEQSRFGPTMGRRFLDPVERDFEEALILIGRKGNVSGFVNTGFIRDSEGRCKIIEFDARPNVWHFTYKFFDIKFREYFEKPKSEPLYPKLEAPMFLYEPYRLFAYNVGHFHMYRALKVLLKREIDGFGKPIPSSFYKPRNLARRWFLFIFFPIFPFRNRILVWIKWFKRRLSDLSPSVWVIPRF